MSGNFGVKSDRIKTLEDKTTEAKQQIRSRNSRECKGTMPSNY